MNNIQQTDPVNRESPNNISEQLPIDESITETGVEPDRAEAAVPHLMTGSESETTDNSRNVTASPDKASSAFMPMTSDMSMNDIFRTDDFCQKGQQNIQESVNELESEYKASDTSEIEKPARDPTITESDTLTHSLPDTCEDSFLASDDKNVNGASAGTAVSEASADQVSELAEMALERSSPIHAEKLGESDAELVTNELSKGSTSLERENEFSSDKDIDNSSDRISEPTPTDAHGAASEIATAENPTDELTTSIHVTREEDELLEDDSDLATVNAAPDEQMQQSVDAPEPGQSERQTEQLGVESGTRESDLLAITSAVSLSSNAMDIEQTDSALTSQVTGSDAASSDSLARQNSSEQAASTAMEVDAAETSQSSTSLSDSSKTSAVLPQSPANADTPAAATETTALSTGDGAGIISNDTAAEAGSSDDPAPKDSPVSMSVPETSKVRL